MSRFHKKNKFKKRFVLILILIIIILFIRYINNIINPILISYAKIEANKISNIVLNYSVKKYINNLDIDKIFISENNINSSEINKLISDITLEIENNFNSIEHGNTLNIKYLDSYNSDDLKKGVIYKIPLFAITKSTLLMNIGPKVPVRLHLYGDIRSNIQTKVSNYGINNALIEIVMNIEINTNVILPFISENEPINVSIPLLMKIIKGDIPNYYGTNSFAIPME